MKTLEQLRLEHAVILNRYAEQKNNYEEALKSIASGKYPNKCLGEFKVQSEWHGPFWCFLGALYEEAGEPWTLLDGYESSYVERGYSVFVPSRTDWEPIKSRYGLSNTEIEYLFRESDDDEDVTLAQIAQGILDEQFGVKGAV